jgi:Holliday junction resolvase
VSKVKYNKVKGAAFEIDVVKWFRDKKFKAERLRLAGKDDEGDVVVVVADQVYLFECKNTASLKLDEFWRQIELEASNYAKARQTKIPLHYVLWKRRRKGINKTWVIQELEQWLEEKNANT